MSYFESIIYAPTSCHAHAQCATIRMDMVCSLAPKTCTSLALQNWRDQNVFVGDRHGYRVMNTDNEWRTTKST